MKSLRSHEGYLLLDNRNGPGVSDELALASGMPVGAGRGVFEAPTYTCSHCQAIVIINPSRTRERTHCRKCDHYLCDQCGAAYGVSGGECKTFKEIIEETQEQAALLIQRGIVVTST